MVLTRPGAEVAGKVIDRSVRRRRRSPRSLIGGDGESLDDESARGPDGTFRFDGLEPGRYTLFASTAAGQAGVLSGVMLSAGTPATGLEVVLEPGAKLRIRYEGNGVGQASVRRNGLNHRRRRHREAGRTRRRSSRRDASRSRSAIPGREQPEVRELEIGKGEEREIVFKQPAGK